MFFGSLYNLRGKKLRDRVDEALHSTGIEEFSDVMFQLYSAGTKQKLNIARSLLGDPELYLLDEPAAHLDPLAREDFWNFIRDVLIDKRRATVFLCTHDLEEARRLADQIVILDAGRVVARGSPSELHALIDGRKELVLRFSGLAPKAWLASMGDSVREDGSGSIRVTMNESELSREELIRSFVENGGALREVHSQSDTLLELLHSKVGRNV